MSPIQCKYLQLNVAWRCNAWGWRSSGSLAWTAKGVPVYTHGTLAPFRGEAVRGPTFVLVSGSCSLCMFRCLRLLFWAACACALYVCLSAPLACMPQRPPLVQSGTVMPTGFLRALNFTEFCGGSWRVCYTWCCFRFLFLQGVCRE